MTDNTTLVARLNDWANNVRYLTREEAAEAAARIAELEADANLFVLLHAFAIEQGYMPDPGESAYDLLQRAIMTGSPRARPVP